MFNVIQGRLARLAPDGAARIHVRPELVCTGLVTEGASIVDTGVVFTAVHNAIGVAGEVETRAAPGTRVVGDTFFVG